MPDLPYQNESQVEQALAERETAEAYGQKTVIAAADKVLATFGISSKADRNRASKRRKAAQADADADAAKSAAPAGRSSAKKSKAD